MEVTNTLELKSIISCIIVASLVANSALVALSETWLTSVVLSFTELGMCGLTLQTLHMALIVFNSLRTCKGTVELFLTSLDAERTKTAETLKTDLLIFCVDVNSWYGGKIVTFATTAGATWRDSRNTCKDRSTNYFSDINRARSTKILSPNYLINKFKVTLFYNTVRSTTDVLNKHRYTTEFRD